jgi:hypothetical protein
LKVSAGDFNLLPVSSTINIVNPSLRHSPTLESIFTTKTTELRPILAFLIEQHANPETHLTSIQPTIVLITIVGIRILLIHTTLDIKYIRSCTIRDHFQVIHTFLCTSTCRP